MSLGRSIQLSGLYWEIKSSSLLLFPFAALYDEGWEGGWKEGPRISDVSYCRERRWQVWHLADETMRCLPRPPRPVKRAKQIALWSQDFDRPLVAGLRDQNASRPAFSRLCVTWEEERFLWDRWMFSCLEQMDAIKGRRGELLAGMGCQTPKNELRTTSWRQAAGTSDISIVGCQDVARRSFCLRPQIHHDAVQKLFSVPSDKCYKSPKII